jgi:mycothiol synthase
VERLVALHRSAFGTSNMSVDQRLAMMRTPRYLRQLDLVAVAPDGEFAAFCVCGFSDSRLQVGYTEPIGTRPDYQGMGLAKAIVSAGLARLKALGARTAGLGTSSENIAMQHLAGTLGFSVVSEKLWFSKPVP